MQIFGHQVGHQNLSSLVTKSHLVTNLVTKLLNIWSPNLEFGHQLVTEKYLVTNLVTNLVINLVTKQVFLVTNSAAISGLGSRC